MTKLNPFKYFKTSPEVIRLAVMVYVRFPLVNQHPIVTPYRRPILTLPELSWPGAA